MALRRESGPGVLSTLGAPDSAWRLWSVFPQPTRDSIWRCVCGGCVLNRSAAHKGQAAGPAIRQPVLSGTSTRAWLPSQGMSSGQPSPPNCSKWPSIWPAYYKLASVFSSTPFPTSHLCLVSYCSSLKTHLRHYIFQEPSLKPSSLSPGLSQVPLLRWLHSI